MELKPQQEELRLAVLVDAENVSHTWIRLIMAEIARYGTPTIKRIYTDWTQPAAGGWKNVLLEHAFTPMQQYRYTAGKNSSDSAMIIDAMDILYSQKVDGFCIVSSDSDFTRLAQRLREAGMHVIGMGVKKTPVPFKASCERFIYIENLKDMAGADQPSVAAAKPQQPAAASSKSSASGQSKQPNGQGKQPGNGQSKPQPAAAAAPQPAVVPTPAPAPVVAEPEDEENAEEEGVFSVDKLIKLLSVTINDLANESGWASLSDVGSLLAKKVPDFDTRNYGYRALMPLVESLGVFEIDKRQTSRRKILHVYIRNKTQA